MIDKTISHYKIIEELGSGGMGVVYKARDLNLDRFVALKFLPMHFSTHELEKERFIHEAKAASALQHHNICTIHEIDETESGQMFICMDLYEGVTLKQKIEQGPLSIEESIHIAVQIAEGLSHAHQKDIVHRDIKPANIFITHDNIVKIVDFGLAKLRGLTKLTVAGTTLGTVAYMSPEQATGQEVDHRTDIWSFGIVLCEMLTGQLPFKGEYDQAVIYSILNSEPSEPKVLNKEVPEPLNHIIMKTLSKKVEDRYQSFREVLKDFKTFQADQLPDTGASAALNVILQKARRPTIFIPTVFILGIVVILMVLVFNRNKKMKWANVEAIPEIERLANEQKYNQAFNLACEALKYIPIDPVLHTLQAWISRPIKIHTDPQGAKIYWKEYAAINDSWKFLGQTPTDSLRFPYGLKRFKIEKDGYQTLYLAPNLCREPDPVLNVVPVDFPVFSLDLIGELPKDMVRVLPINIAYIYEFFETFECSEFLMDKYEVTNRDFKSFVDSGGYQNKEYWKQPFFKNNERLSWQQAMSYFRDRTGRQGPATWEVGDYPDGQEDFPVTGISWYEAAAYAEFKGKNLPTCTHWACAAGFESGPTIIRFSNFHGKGPVSVGDKQGLGPYGTYDMAGNVREWCWNKKLPGNKRFILGGGWNDPDYEFGGIYTNQDPFDRSETNGFRCVKYFKSDSSLARLSEPVTHTYRDYTKEKPVSDFEFNLFLRMYAYPKTDLNSALESVFEHETDWTIEKVSFDAAYGNERVFAYLFLPRNSTPPFQTVIFFSGSHAIGGEPSAATRINHTNHFDYILKSGRAVLFPIYKGTFERSFPPEIKIYDKYLYRDWIIMCAKDLNRSVDYLETRSDIDIDKLAYLGLSFGAHRAGVLLAIEQRLKGAVLYVGGLARGYSPFPEVDAFNFVPRIKIPVLMLNGKYDHWFPYETSQKPFFEMLGTPDEHKKHFTYDTWHLVPRDQMIKETLAWLDKYLGPVE